MPPDDEAIKFGNPIPRGYKVMEIFSCRTCREEFWIIHDEKLKDAKRAKKQSGEMEDHLAGEHVDGNNFKGHLEKYGPLNS